MTENYKNSIMESVRQHLPELLEIKKYLFENPEIGGTEKKASAFLIQYAREQGFTVEENYCGIPYAFRAVYDTGKPGATIGYCAEYDALPGIGHGCGHNMIAAISTGAAVALKENAQSGRVILFGTPAEENFVRKADLAKAGAFADVDACMMVHPSNENRACSKTTAIDAYQVDFFGRSSHAGGAPEKGINALDAAVDFYAMIREKTPADVNIHGVIAEGGVKPSIIPDKASLQYFCRAYSSEKLKKVKILFEECAEAAAKGVGATFRIWNYEPSNKDMVPNEALSEVFNDSFRSVGGGTMLPGEVSGGSTDMGDVSYVCPALHSWVYISDANNHSVEFANATMTPFADSVVERSAAALALAGRRVMSEPELQNRIKEEFLHNDEIK